MRRKKADGREDGGRRPRNAIGSGWIGGTERGRPSTSYGWPGRCAGNQCAEADFLELHPQFCDATDGSSSRANPWAEPRALRKNAWLANRPRIVRTEKGPSSSWLSEPPHTHKRRPANSPHDPNTETQLSTCSNERKWCGRPCRKRSATSVGAHPPAARRAPTTRKAWAALRTETSTAIQAITRHHKGFEGAPPWTNKVTLTTMTTLRRGHAHAHELKPRYSSGSGR